MIPEIKTIVVPVDFSSSSTRALEYAHGLAARFNAALHLVHVCEVPAMTTSSLTAYAITYSEWAQRLGEEAGQMLAKSAATVTDVPVTTSVLFGNASRSIVAEAAKIGADLIVMGTNGHGPVMHLMLGNVAERVVRTATCPVLTIREPKANDPVAAEPFNDGATSGIL
jgi:nucleotide-binding universal stress UspA family protein